MLTEIGSYISGILEKLKDVAFPLFVCSGAFLLFGAHIASLAELDGGKLPGSYVLIAWAVLFLSGSTLVQMLAAAVSKKIAKVRSQSHKQKVIDARRQQRLESLNSLNEREASVLLECLRNSEKTFCRAYTDAAAMSLANKGIVDARTQGHPLDMPFTISNEVWNHLTDDKNRWLQTLSEKCQPKRTSRRR